jgi:rRNA maturation endonuclease Nob1
VVVNSTALNKKIKGNLMANVYLYSTMSADNCYANHEELPNGLHVKKEKLLVAGKANVSDPKTLLTPTGMMTTVDEAEFKKFENNSMMKRHIEGGFIKVVKSKQEVETVVKDMTKKDKSAQKTADDFKPNKRK